MAEAVVLTGLPPPFYWYAPIVVGQGAVRPAARRCPVRALTVLPGSAGPLAVDARAAADAGWLGRLVSRRVPLESSTEAFDARDSDVEVVLDLQ